MGLLKSLKKRKKRKDEIVRKSSLITNAIKALGSELIVRNGPFKGMLYPKMESSGSELYPKLLGSYEKELISTIKEICQNNYSEIIDIGCAEGYYGIGLALRIKNSNLYLYDVNEQALKLAKEMAKMNGVDNRITFGNLCTPEVLLSIPYRNKALIVTDCEGCEKHMFTEDIVSQMLNHDFLIETHDLFDIEISTYLTEVFSKTHDVTIISSIDDIQKAKYYQYDELKFYDLETKRILLAEQRGSIIEWLYVKSKQL